MATPSGVPARLYTRLTSTPPPGSPNFVVALSGPQESLRNLGSPWPPVGARDLQFAGHDTRGRDSLSRQQSQPERKPTANRWYTLAVSSVPQKQELALDLGMVAGGGLDIGNFWARNNAAGPGVPNAGPALGWALDASPVECGKTATTGWRRRAAVSRLSCA